LISIFNFIDETFAILYVYSMLSRGQNKRLHQQLPAGF